MDEKTDLLIEIVELSATVHLTLWELSKGKASNTCSVRTLWEAGASSEWSLLKMSLSNWEHIRIVYAKCREIPFQ